MTENAVCNCPACKHERSDSTAAYIPVGVELIEELDAHPERAKRLLQVGQ